MSDPTSPAATFSSWIDRLFKPLAQPTGEALGGLAGGVAHLIAPQYEQRAREAATRAGEGLPRFGAEALAYGAKNPWLKIAGLGDVALKNYAESGGDVPSTLAQTGAFAAAPAVGRLGENVASMAARPLERAIASPRASFLAGEAVRRTGSTAAGLLPFTAANALESSRKGQPFDPLSLENVVGTAASVLPFEAMHLPRIVKGLREAGAPLVNETPVSDSAQSHRVAWENQDGLQSRDFLSEENAGVFADELRKHGLTPQVEPAGTVQRSWVKHDMAFRPEQLQGEVFGYNTSERLNEMPDVAMPSQQMWGTLKNKVPPSELEALPGLEEHIRSKGKIAPREVQDWLDQNAPKVEVRKTGAGIVSERARINRRMSEIQHQLETEGIRTEYADDGQLKFSAEQTYGLNPERRAAALELIRESNRLRFAWNDAAETSGMGDANWAFVSPKPKDQMPGYVEIAVVRPHTTPEGGLPGYEAQYSTARPNAPETRAAGIRFPSSHSFPPNTLGFTRGYMETVNGKKMFHIIEAQSDWAARQREMQEVSKRYKPGDKRLQEVANLQDPLLRNWERLLLRATVHHALSEGADAIAVSDPETAMMTEGHDQLAPPASPAFPTEADAQASIKRAKQQGVDGPLYIRKTTDGWQVLEAPPYEKGMRLHYGQTLPGILREITGEKGTSVDFGEHKMAMYETPPIGEKLPRENLIFKNPDGTPKTTTSALSFPLDKARGALAARNGFPLYGSAAYVKAHAAEMQLAGYDPSQIVQAADNVKRLPALPGETPLQTLARSTGMDPRLFARMAPGEALPRAFEFLTSMFHYNYGEPVDRAAYLAKQVMVPLARFAPWLKQTSLAVVPAEAGKFFGAKPPDSEVFQYLIGVPDFPRGVMNARQTMESQVFEIARTLGHEATHNALTEALNPVGDTDPRQYQAALRALAQVEAIPEDQRAPILQNMLRLIVPAKRWPEISKINFQRSVASPEEFLADFASIISVGALDKKTLRSMRDALTFGDEASKDFSSAVYRDLTSIWGGVRNWLSMMPGKNKQLSDLVGSVYDNMTALMATKEDAYRTVQSFSAMMDRMMSGPLDPPPVVTSQQMHALFRAIDPLNDVPGVPKEESMKFVDDVLAAMRPEESKIGGERLGFFKDFFKPMGQLVESLKEKVPSVVPVFGLATDYRGYASQLQTEAWKMFSNGKGGVDWQRLRWINKQDSPQNTAFNQIALVENVRTQNDHALTTMTRDKRDTVSAAYKALPIEDKDRVDQSLDEMNAMGKFLAQKKWNAFRDRVSWGMAKVIMSYNKNLYHDKAKDFADKAVWAVFDDDPGAEGVFASIPIADPAKALLLSKIQENKVEWLKMGDKMLGAVDPNTGLRPGKTFYLPEVRIGDWQLSYKLKGEDTPHHEAFKTSVEASRRLKAVQSNPDLDWVKPFNAKDRADRFRGMVQEDISAVQQDALDVLYNSVLSGISMEHPEAQELIDQIKREVQPAAAFANIAVSPYMREREFIPGREDLNMVEGMTRYVDASAYNVAKGHVKQATIAALFNPDMRANPNIRNEFQKYVNFVTDAEGKEFTMMKNLVFFNYIGFNPATMLQEPAQQLVSLVPYLIEHGMGVGEAYKALRKANMSLIQHTVKGKLDDPVYNRALEEGIAKRVVDTGFISDLYGETDHDFASQMSATMGRDGIQSRADLVRKPLYQLLSVARHAYGMVTAANSKAAFLASFDMEYQRSHDYSKAMQFATQATYATMYGGGKAARPLVLQQFGSMSGVGGLMYTLGSYSLNTITMMGRLARKAVLDSNLTPADKRSAMHAAGVMFATQFALAGALGMPLVAPGLALLEQVFPGLDARKLVREGAVNLAKYASDDEDMGHAMADGALRGVMNLSGTDMGSRFQLANMLGVSPYDGFSWNNVAGPAVSMLQDWVKAVGQASTGHYGDAARTAAPASLKNVLNLIHNDWDVRDKAGRLITTMTPGEKGMALLGFKPQRLTHFYEEQQIRERAEAYKAMQLRDIKQDAAKRLVAGDLAGARKTILDGVQTAGPYDPYSMSNEAAQLAQDMVNPTVRRSASRTMAQTEGDISRLYPKTVTQTELQRMIQSRGMQEGMGLGVRPRSGEFRNAALIDQIMASNPKLTLPEARVMAEQMTSRSTQRHLSVLQ